MEKLSNEAMQQKMELQLHEQYAVNNNANLSSILALIGVLIVTLGFFYKVFCETNNIEEMNATNPFVLLFISIHFVLFIIFFISLFQGTKQRCEQFIIFAIRDKYYPDIENEVAPYSGRKNRIFPRGYHPYGKNIFSMVQGIYQYICIGSILIALFITFMTISKFQHCCCFLLVLLIFLIFIVISVCGQRKKYKNYERAFDKYNPMPREILFINE